MLNPRLLIVLSALPDAETGLWMVLDALAHARHPFSLRFALPVPLEQEVRTAAPPEAALKQSDLLFYNEAAGLAALPPLLTDETHFLSLPGVYGFAQGWDRMLFSRLSRTGAPRALLTAVIVGQEAQAQPCLPALSGPFGPQGAPLGAGLPLVCSAAPVRTLLVHPGCVLGRVAFLRTAGLEPALLSFAAFGTETPVYALDRAPFWPLSQLPVAMLRLPGPELLPPPAVERFTQRLGADPAGGILSPRALWGLFGPEEGYAQRMPLAPALQRAAASLLKRTAEPAPLVVTAWVDTPDPPCPPQLALLRFVYLSALRALPLALYAGGELERPLRAKFPNTLAYPEHALLPRALTAAGATRRQLFARGRIALLERAMRAYPTFDTLAWVDFDAMPHPVCPQACPDFTVLLDDRVHIGWVANEPDATLLVVPRRLIKLLLEEAQSITQLDAEMHRGFAEAAFYRRLIRKFPDLFVLHPLPARGLLWLPLFDPALLSAEIRPLLAALPAPQHASDILTEAKENEPHA